MTAPTPMQLMIVLLVFVLLFGAKKLPDLARSVGRSSRILRSELSAKEEPGDPAAQQPGRPDGDGSQSRLDQ
ncbi:twin-arginine translocase TatA/TatE family subunit [Pseudonocardia sp. HH130630-07]|uniref:twin-arginine translocase TatA/TatE family subunit n=1 Tax=Pseudonocardia sp. HH130630-07 TaxID=1690815 RepID=UPI0009F59112|nr:twin-arginine translocase TatA/TatE family subunit [Pseudonocardia sp. HH130630-07]